MCLFGRKKKKRLEQNFKNPKQKFDLMIFASEELLNYYCTEQTQRRYIYIFIRERDTQNSKCNRYSPDKFQHLMLLLVQEDPVVIKTSRQS
jgi:hypothetical protein